MSSFLLELAPLPGEHWPPPPVRLRRALKALGRSYGLRVVRVCVSPVRDAPASLPDQPAADQPPKPAA